MNDRRVGRLGWWIGQTNTEQTIPKETVVPVPFENKTKQNFTAQTELLHVLYHVPIYVMYLCTEVK